MTEEKAPTTVKDGVVVSIDYELTVDGEILDASEESEPLEYLHGYSNIVPGLEDKLTGLSIGDTIKVTVSPDDGYGEYDEEAVARVPRIEFPAEIPLEVGVEIAVREEDGSLMSATIAWVGADEVELDFNHELAGKTLHFDVKILGLRLPTDEELEHGHAHGAGHDHHEEDEFED
jgi:FKBP-type peptidyl-prolyl cis-trans isomerase SlyD